MLIHGGLAKREGSVDSDQRGSILEFKWYFRFVKNVNNRVTLEHVAQVHFDLHQSRSKVGTDVVVQRRSALSNRQISRRSESELNANTEISIVEVVSVRSGVPVPSSDVEAKFDRSSTAFRSTLTTCQRYKNIENTIDNVESRMGRVSNEFQAVGRRKHEEDQV